MADTIVRNSTPAAPIANLLRVVHGYDAEWEVEHILHPKMNGNGFNVTYRPTRDRSGTLTLLFATAAHAHAAIGVLRSPHTFTLAADVAALNMTFVLKPGALKAIPEPRVSAWTVSLEYQAV